MLTYISESLTFSVLMTFDSKVQKSVVTCFENEGEQTSCLIETILKELMAHIETRLVGLGISAPHNLGSEFIRFMRVSSQFSSNCKYMVFIHWNSVSNAQVETLC